MANEEKTMAELAYMSAKMLIMSECEDRGLDDKIEDPITYNMVVSNFTNGYVTNVMVFGKRYSNGIDPSEAVMKANDKALDIVKKNIQMLMED